MIKGLQNIYLSDMIIIKVALINTIILFSNHKLISIYGHIIKITINKIGRSNKGKQQNVKNKANKDSYKLKAI